MKYILLTLTLVACAYEPAPGIRQLQGIEAEAARCVADTYKLKHNIAAYVHGVDSIHITYLNAVDFETYGDRVCAPTRTPEDCWAERLFPVAGYYNNGVIHIWEGYRNDTATLARLVLHESLHHFMETEGPTEAALLSWWHEDGVTERQYWPCGGAPDCKSGNTVYEQAVRLCRHRGYM